MPYSSHAQVGKAEPMPNDGSVTGEELASTWRAENESRRLDLQERQRVDQSASSSGSSTSGNALTRKAGPLPVWAWILIGSVAAYVIYKKFAGNTTGTTTAVSNLLPGGTSDASGSTDGSTGASAGTTPASGGAPSGYRLITPAEWAANLGNIYQELTPGTFTLYTGKVSLLTKPGFVPYWNTPQTASSATAPTSPTSPTGVGTVAGGTPMGNPPVSRPPGPLGMASPLAASPISAKSLFSSH